MTKITIAISLANELPGGYVTGQQDHRLYLVQGDSVKGALGALELTLRGDR